MPNHKVITADYPENLANGIMVCGINFGYSIEDEVLDLSGIHPYFEPRSFFSDDSVNNTRFRNKILEWLASWGITLERSKGAAGGLERSFFQTNWLDTQTKSIISDGAITIEELVHNADGVLYLLRQRTPRTIIFVGSTLIEALNDTRLRSRVEIILGARSGNAVINQCDVSNGDHKRFKILTQSFGNTHIIGLPHTQSRGLTDEYMAKFKAVTLPLISHTTEYLLGSK